MMSSSDRSPDYFSGLLVGFLVLAVFGVATYLMFGAMDLKQPVERTYGGDFSTEVSEQRLRNREMVDEEQSGSFDAAEVSAELSKIKPAPAAKSGVVVPGSPTALGGAQAPAETEVKEEAETKAAPEPDKSTDAPEAAAEKAEPAPAAPAGGKAKAKAKDAPKAKAKTKAKAKAAKSKGEAKGKTKAQGAPKAKGSGKAKSKGDNRQGKAKAAADTAPEAGEPEAEQENGAE